MNKAEATTRRIHSLDSLRGIAALVVVFYHCSMVVPGFREALYASYIARPLIIGPSAVDVFFVLSGMVLYGAFAAKVDFRYFPYLTKRMLRLYPPLCVTVLISLAIYLGIKPHGVAKASDWFNSASWSRAPTFDLIAGHLLLRDPWEYSSLNNVIWSLVHEIRISVVFPFLALALRARLWMTLLICLLSFAETSWVANLKGSNDFLDLLRTVHYASLFAAGALLALKREALVSWFAAPRRRLFGFGILFAGIVLLCREDSDPAVALGSILTVLACSAAPPIERLLSRKPLRALGKISYSLYLTHLVLLLTLVHAFADLLPIPMLSLLTLALAPLVATATFYLVERPSMLAGKRAAHIMMVRRQDPADREISVKPSTRLA